MHDEGVVHGDLKGVCLQAHGHRPAFNPPRSQANISINNDGHACLADSILLTIALKQSINLSAGGLDVATQWMSPELLDPELFGLKKSQPTKESDCYALGMLIYEVLSGQTPFAPSKLPAVIRMVLDGQRPERPQGEEGKLFTDAVWRVLQLCWKQKPKERINAKTVLSRLEETPSSSRPSHSMDGIVETDTEEESDAAAGDPGVFSPFRGRPRAHLRSLLWYKRSHNYTRWWRGPANSITGSSRYNNNSPQDNNSPHGNGPKDPPLAPGPTTQSSSWRDTPNDSIG